MPTRDTSRSPLANAQPSLRSSSLGAVFMGLAALSTTGCGDASGVGTSGEAATPRTARQALTGRPASCQELKTAQPAAADGQYVLYVNGDATKPWTAYCHDMAGTPKEYLSLPSTGPSLNFSQYTAGYNNGWGATNVRTLFSKVRVDPATLRVTTGDQTFSSSSGLLWHGDAVTSMSYAAAMNCDFGSPGLGNVDLRGTSFAVAPNQFVAVGHYASGGANYSANDQVVDLWNYGECGWMSVQGADHPLNGRSAQLQLQYKQSTPASCQEFKTAQPAAADGQYVLYVNGEATKPWTAYCHDMAGTPKEYLSLPSTGPSLNFSQYTAGYNNGWGATNVRTLFSKVRVDPATLRVTTGDQTFSSSSGLLWHGDAVTSMSYAAAMNCDFGSPGLGNVDLRGTSFAVAPNQFVAVGHYASGGANYSANDQVVDLWNYGECGWMSVQGADHPLNGRSAQLQLQYRQQQPTQTRIDSLSWQAAGPGTRSATPGGQLADTMSFDYSLGGTDVWSFQTWNFTTTAQESKVLNFDWNYVGFHAWYMVWASATAFADGPNGRTTVPLYTQNYGGNWDVSGSASLQLHQGYPFGVIVEGQNFDSHSYLQGSVKLTQKP